MEDFQISSGYRIRMIESLDDGTIYQGFSKRGEPLDSDNWQIAKIYESGTITSLSYARGSWNDRASLTYV